ncbi:hypothetical protein [Williamsia serinedens]|uniref:Uncharacterized protein n=1 Tax=Williamsia serinedens TaxID=391736 RepID=A0ABT1H8U7_9NOCA|nr:hypothetical protein [Williamsia serinedens]MCP2163137.1 hypothetical protein [Williamsia serinedens]
MSTAYRLDYWSITYTDDDGAEHTKWFPLDLSMYGGQAWLFRLDPPTLDGHEYVLICDRGYLLAVTTIEGEPENIDVPTRIENIVEVFAARPDGSVESMTAVRTPTSLKRPADGIDVAAILTALGYDDSGQLQYLKADGTLTTGTAAQIAAWEAQKADE